MSFDWWRVLIYFLRAAYGAPGARAAMRRQFPI
jgi:hypothetical protein